MKQKLTVVTAILIIFVGYHLFSPLFITSESNELFPRVDYVMGSPGGTLIKPVVEEFYGEVTSFEKKASGNVYVYNNNDQMILRFENFETVNGPGLSVYLSKDIGIEDSVFIGKLKATKGSMNYEVPLGTDFSEYDSVLIWCDTYDFLYSYAELNKKIK